MELAEHKLFKSFQRFKPFKAFDAQYILEVVPESRSQVNNYGAFLYLSNRTSLF